MNTSIYPNPWTQLWNPSIPVSYPPVNIIPAPRKNLGESFKPVKAGRTSSHVVFILDDSSSMQSCLDATIEGFNGFLAKQRQDSVEMPIYVSLYKFDGPNVKTVYNRENVKEVPNLDRDSYDPQGMTNLLDAFGAVMIQVNNNLAEQAESGRDSVIITLLTDGQENASKTFTNNDLKQMVEKAQGQMWAFMFLGANIDAFHTGAQLGFTSHNTMAYSTKNMTSAINAAAAMSSRTRSAVSSGLAESVGINAMYLSTGFTDQERDDSND